MLRVKSLSDPLPLNLDGVPDWSLFIRDIRSLGASPGLWKYQDRQGGLQPVRGVLALHLNSTVCPAPAVWTAGVTVIWPLETEIRVQMQMLIIAVVESAVMMMMMMMWKIVFVLLSVIKCSTHSTRNTLTHSQCKPVCVTESRQHQLVCPD